MKWNNGPHAAASPPGKDKLHRATAQADQPQAVYALTADLYERNEYGDFDDSSTLLEGSELRGYQNQDHGGTGEKPDAGGNRARSHALV
mgnify:CR=1 FL=1